MDTYAHIGQRFGTVGPCKYFKYPYRKLMALAARCTLLSGDEVNTDCDGVDGRTFSSLLVGSTSDGTGGFVSSRLVIVCMGAFVGLLFRRGVLLVR